MKPALLLLVGLLAVGASSDARLGPPHPGAATESGLGGVGHPSANQAARNLVSAVHDLRSTRTGFNGMGSRPDLGNVRKDVDQLRRAGLNVEAIEYYASDLEQSLRAGRQNVSGARHALNNLEHEASVLRQRLGRGTR